MVKSSSAPAGARGRRPARTLLSRLVVLGGLVLPVAIGVGFTVEPARGAVREALSTTVAPSPLPQLPEPSSTPAISRISPLSEEPAAAQPLPPAVFPALAGLSPHAVERALDAVACARSRGVSGRSDVLTLIDYSLPSTEPRLWVLDLKRKTVLFHELVAHGAGSGDNFATQFSNVDGSRQTSLGLFLTRDTYIGGHGRSLKLDGLDSGVNDRALDRQIVMHGAWYVSQEQIRRTGRLGRSWGCPALSEAVAQRVIDLIQGGSFVFSYSAAAEGSIQTASTNRCGGAKAAPALPVTTAAATATTTAAVVTAAAGIVR